ncbi:MAG: TAXI family TRAP transporter solute-binding subunit [Alphaproteobacteria bacterium]|nr:TAXI family TRAP transporter solute-binding subunit [Alphaproteobacteria bacterium]
MRYSPIIAIVGALGLGAGQLGAAEPLGIGTSGQGAATYSMGSAIAKVAKEKAGLEIRVQPHGGTGKVVPLVNSGRLDLGLANILEVTNAVKGRGPFKGRPHPNLKLVGVMYPFRVGFFVRKGSAIRDHRDIKGKRIGAGYTSQRIIGTLVKAVLNNAGLTMADMKPVPVVNILRQADDFIAGKLDVGFFAMGSGKVKQIDAAVGGIRFISIDPSAAAVERMRKVVSKSFAQLTPKSSGITGVTQDIHAMAYDYLLYAGAHVPDAQVHALAKAVAQNRAALAASFRAFNSLDPKKMAKNIGLPYHPGAVRFYKEAKLWPSGM